jgi:hypothetical protein
VRFLAIPRPPSSWTEPVFSSPKVLSVMFENVVIPEKSLLESTSNVPVTVVIPVKVELADPAPHVKLPLPSLVRTESATPSLGGNTSV